MPVLDAAAARRWAVGIACGLLAGALWGLVFVAPRMLPGVPSVDLTAGRFVSYGAMAALLMLLGLRTHRLPNGREALAALGLSVLGFTGYYLLLVLAVRDAGTEMGSSSFRVEPNSHNDSWSSSPVGMCA
ncbi:MAG: EamA family transporter, partial [Burkholderiaceae bacterium]